MCTILKLTKTSSVGGVVNAFIANDTISYSYYKDPEHSIIILYPTNKPFVINGVSC